MSNLYRWLKDEFKKRGGLNRIKSTPDGREKQKAKLIEILMEGHMNPMPPLRRTK